MQFCFCLSLDQMLLYYIKVSGIPSGNKIDKNNTISSHVKISMISLISSLSLKLYLINLLGYHRNIFGSSSKVFGNSRKMFGNVRLAFGTILKNLRKSSENHQKRRYQYVYIIKSTLHVGSKIEFYVPVARTISHSFAAFTREMLFLPLEHKIHIFSPLCNILHIF